MGIKKLWFLPVVFMVLFAACKTAQEAVSSNEPENSTQSSEMKYEALDKALLWKISKDNMDNPSYLYGTIHIIPSEEYFLPTGTLEAIGNSERMVFEIDMKEMNDIGKQMSLLAGAFMKDGLTLKDLYTDEEYKIVKDNFDKMGIPLFFMERLKPMLLTIFASGDIDPTSLQSGKSKSYEMEFLELAESSKIKTGGLETMDYQMSLFDSIPYSDQAEMLLESIQLSDEDNASFQAMIDVYKNQDIEAMQTMFEEEDGGIEGHEDILLINRNRNWIPVMKDFMKEGTVFFAVGAGHLAGKEGVIHLLRKAGYKLEPVL